MAKFWTISAHGGSYRALRRANESFETASQRAVKRAFGPSAVAAYWREDGREEVNGRVARMHLCATVTGRTLRDGSRPILGEARAYLTIQDE